MRFCSTEFVSEPGSPIHVLYAPKVGKDGVIDLVEAGTENTDDIIQSYAASTDINVILSRVANGETNLLKQRNGIFGDFTGMPKTYAEALQLHIDSNRLFASLPPDIRKKFDDDENKFFASAGSEEWFGHIESIMPDEVKDLFKKGEEIKPIEKPVVKPVEKEVKE